MTESKEEPQRKEEEEEEKERVGEGEGGETEGNLTHSRSQQEMEQLLASAASDDEESEDNSPWVIRISHACHMTLHHISELYKVVDVSVYPLFLDMYQPSLYQNYLLIVE